MAGGGGDGFQERRGRARDLMTAGRRGLCVLEASSMALPSGHKRGYFVTGDGKQELTFPHQDQFSGFHGVIIGI